MWFNLKVLYDRIPKGKKRLFQFSKADISLICLQSEAKFFSLVI